MVLAAATQDLREGIVPRKFVQMIVRVTEFVRKTISHANVILDGLDTIVP